MIELVTPWGPIGMTWEHAVILWIALVVLAVVHGGSNR